MGASKSDTPVILWLRRDLRLADNPALAAAAATGSPVLPVYILDDDGAGAWRPGAAGRWWLHHSLGSLAQDLAARGAPLLLRRGASDRVLAQIIAETGAGAVFWNRLCEPWAIRRDGRITAQLGSLGVAATTLNGTLLHEPSNIRNKAGEAFRVFTPFWRACLAAAPPPAPMPRPGTLYGAAMLSGERLEDWRLLPTHPDWSAGLKEQWQPGETGAWKRLRGFLDAALADYGVERDRPDRHGTSFLSPHLHWGELSAGQIWHAVQQRTAEGAAPFQRQLGWREFCHHLLCAFPDLPEEPLDRRFGDFPWRSDPAALAAWRRGRTGYPIVDAGMRQLWQTGWMHNRVRMIVASFLVKHLLLPWQEGERWFWDTLVDADLANNAASWQWVAGCGADAAPYFRIFNPILQGERFDPDGGYVRRFVPELDGLPARYIHRPWEAPASLLSTAGVRLGETYPHPIVDHRAARQRALAAFHGLRSAKGGGPSRKKQRNVR